MSDQSVISETDVEEVFSLLGNDVRMSILHALWERYDPLVEDNTVAFAELYDATDVDDSGQFNYHLDKLRGRYVEKTDGGYRLRPVGLRLVQSVVPGAGHEFTIERTELDFECRDCGNPTAITYQDNYLYHVCTHCEGHFGDQEGLPEGTLTGADAPASSGHEPLP